MNNRRNNKNGRKENNLRSKNKSKYGKDDSEKWSSHKRTDRRKTNNETTQEERTDKPYEKTDRTSKPYTKKYTDKSKAKKYSSKKPNLPKESSDGRIRLNKFLSNAGMCSRREADQFISVGLVNVNGKIITELGYKIDPTDKVKLNDRTVQTERKVYLLLNKPKDFVTTVSDPHAKRTVMELLKGTGKERIYPVGRLDRMTTGVLLFTNDGDLTKRLTHPSFNRKKIYHVHTDKSVTAKDLHALAEGVELEDGMVGADVVSYVDATDKKQIGLEIHSGQNRVVRRMFEKLGYRVHKLDRVYFAGLTKKGLSRGQWRYLDQKEVNLLKSGAFK